MKRMMRALTMREPLAVELAMTCRSSLADLGFWRMGAPNVSKPTGKVEALEQGGWETKS